MSLIALCGAVVASGCLFPTEQDPDTGRRVAEFQAVASVQEAALLPEADTYLRQGAPNQNQGSDPILRLQASGNNRALLRFDRAAIAAAVGAGTLEGARLEFMIAFNADNWGSAGRTIDLHRLTQAWTEAGATWNCADDTNQANQSADCAGETAWSMSGSGARPWEEVPAATATITNGLSGVVSFDVTAEVAAVLAGGGEHHGWILKKTLEGQAGRVEFGSRESGTPPRLVLEVGTQQVWPILSGVLPPFDTTRVVALPSGHLLYRTDITLRFKEPVSDSAKAAFFTRHGMIVLGVVVPGKFFVRLPDPGLPLDSLFQALRRIRSTPEIELATFIDRSPPQESIDARYPEDVPALPRSRWFDDSEHLWAMREIRAPLAWGCSTGQYGEILPMVGIFEWKHQRFQPDYAASAPGLWEPPDADLAHLPSISTARVVELEKHAASTTGLLSSEGDNRSGISGMMWRTSLHLYAGSTSPNNHRLPLLDNFFALGEKVVADQVRILSFSADATIDSTLADPSEQTEKRLFRKSCG